jgi:hypothetical protein
MSIFDESTFQISLNETNLVASENNNVFSYNFPGTVKFTRDTKVALSKTNIFFSWFNITEAFENNRFDFIWTDGSGSTTFNVTVPDGYYSVSTLNSYLQSVLIANGLYLVNASNENVYYLEITVNPTFYAVQLNLFPFPTALPAGWSNPTGLTFPGVASTPQFIILNNAFSDYVGISPGTYPTAIQSTVQSFISDFTPQVDPIQSIVIATNLVNNKYSNPPNVFYPFSNEGPEFGGLISSEPNELIYLDVQEGYYSNIQIRFLDQSFNDIKLNDPNIVVQLIFKVRRDEVNL